MPLRANIHSIHLKGSLRGGVPLSWCAKPSGSPKSAHRCRLVSHQKISNGFYKNLATELTCKSALNGCISAFTSPNVSVQDESTSTQMNVREVFLKNIWLKCPNSSRFHSKIQLEAMYSNSLSQFCPNSWQDRGVRVILVKRWRERTSVVTRKRLAESILTSWT